MNTQNADPEVEKRRLLEGQSGRCGANSSDRDAQPGRTALLMVHSVQAWAEEISKRFLFHTAEAVEFGRIVHRCRLALGRGQWAEMFRRRSELQLPFGKTTAKKWCAIGEVCGAIGQEPDHLTKLPGGFEALYQLSRLGTELLLKAVEEGAVTPDLNETTARQVAQRYRPELKRKPRPFGLRQFVDDLRKALELLAEQAAPAELEMLVSELEQMAGWAKQKLAGARLCEARRTPERGQPCPRAFAI